ncbi:RecB family exonuclease [Desertimonas flava]|uniref:RecB family exonuclease n=1 Tax=Desertimonas flava TaxID=2064846 RepID=UPI0013C47678|nr:PD-(D/E)XK nuclease family protein [Desertimonas flava]
MTTFEPPTTLSPSRIKSFLTCPLQFRFEYVEKLPGTVNRAAVLGSTVHLGLEYLFERHPAGERDRAAAVACIADAVAEFRDDAEYQTLALDDKEVVKFGKEAQSLASKYLDMENPNAVAVIANELWVEHDIGGVTLRGKIDRLDEHGDMTVGIVDYKTGRPPSQRFEQDAMFGVWCYALLVLVTREEMPSRARLMYLSSRETIDVTPTPQSLRGVRGKVLAVHQAISRSCERGDFRPAPTQKICDRCRYRPFCPAYGGEPDDAAAALADAGLVPA